jgi:hypothetical protein
MNDARQFEETLATIRRLMERGTRYEAITGRGALLAGLAAVATSGILRFGPWHGDAAFLGAWVAVAVAAASWILASALRGARQSDPEGRRISAQARAVALEVAPAMAAAVLITAGLWRVGASSLLPCAWMLLHGVAILATAAHAPRRLVRLGALFLVAGGLLALVPLDRDLAMALGFGGLNLAYGVLSVVSAERDDD